MYYRIISTGFFVVGFGILFLFVLIANFFSILPMNKYDLLPAFGFMLLFIGMSAECVNLKQTIKNAVVS